MSESARDVLKAVVEDQRSRHYPGMVVGKYFEIFSSEQILKILGFDPDSQQIESGIVGGGNEGGVDSIYLFCNKRLIREDTSLNDFKGQQVNLELIVVQSKHETSFKESAITKFNDFAENCLKFGADFTAAPCTTLYSPALLDAVKRFHKLYKPSQRPTLTLKFYYASVADRVDSKVATRRDLLIKRLSELYSIAECRCEFIGADRLWQWYNEPVSPTLPLECSAVLRWPPSGKSYVGLVSLGKFYEFITREGSLRATLFESNVRDHHASATVNAQIRETLEVSGNEDFWWLNNGVTLLASEASADGNLITVTNALIVNGLQTSYEIFYHFGRITSRDDTRSVLVRVIKTTNANSVDNIIKATNSQTRIPSIWLHATEEIHRKIEVLLKKTRFITTAGKITTAMRAGPLLRLLRFHI